MGPSHPDRASPNFVGVCIATGVLNLFSTICVALRFVSQHRKRELWWDDWTIVAALIFTIGLFVNTILVTMPSLGASGYHIETYTVMQLNTWSKLCLSGEVLYNCSILLSRISMLLFYRRVFSVDGRFLVFTRIMMALIASSGFASVLGFIFMEYPVRVQRTPVNTKAFYVALSVINIGLDLAVFGLVQFKVWRLKMNIKRKTLLSLLLLLAAFSIVASILRLAYLLMVDWTDITYTLAAAWLWTTVEPILYIICACLPGVYSFFRAILGSLSNGSSKPTYRAEPQPPTIGSTPLRLKRNREEEEEDAIGLSDDHFTCEPGPEGDCYSMTSLDPVRARRDFTVTTN